MHGHDRGDHPRRHRPKDSKGTDEREMEERLPAKVGTMHPGDSGASKLQGGTEGSPGPPIYRKEKSKGPESGPIELDKSIKLMGCR